MVLFLIAAIGSALLGVQVLAHDRTRRRPRA